MPQVSKESFTARTEEWRPIPGYEGLYSASSSGQVRSEDRTLYTKGGVKHYHGRLFSATPGKDGYIAVTLVKDYVHTKKRLHQWIMLTFEGPCPPGHEIRHLDGDKSNCAFSNLEYGTSQDNSNDCRAHNHFRRGLDHQNAFVTDEQVAEMLALPRGTRSNNVVGKWADKNGISRGHVYNIRARHRRKD